MGSVRTRWSQKGLSHEKWQKRHGHGSPSVWTKEAAMPPPRTDADGRGALSRKSGLHLAMTYTCDLKTVPRKPDSNTGDEGLGKPWMASPPPPASFPDPGRTKIRRGSRWRWRNTCKTFPQVGLNSPQKTPRAWLPTLLGPQLASEGLDRNTGGPSVSAANAHWDFLSIRQ